MKTVSVVLAEETLMDNITFLTVIGYIFVFAVYWYILYRVANRFLGILMPWVLKTASGILAAFIVWKFCVVHVSF